MICDLRFAIGTMLGLKLSLFWFRRLRLRGSRGATVTNAGLPRRLIREAASGVKSVNCKSQIKNRKSFPLATSPAILYFPPRVLHEVHFTSELPERRLPVRLLLAANHLFTRVYHQVSVKTSCPLPSKGPAILVCNHVSGLDPLLVQSGVPRRLITWMMAAEYYNISRAMDWMFKTVEVIPVQRSGRDLAATRMALRALHTGRILGIFPEGKIAETRELLPFQTGVALMAIKANVPVFPAYLDGTQRGKEMVPAVVSPNRSTLLFGPQVKLDSSSTSRESLEQNTQRIRQAIIDLQLQATERYNSATQ